MSFQLAQLRRNALPAQLEYFFSIFATLLSQKKFSATNGAVDAENWKIPISFIKSSDSKTEQVLMTEQSIDVEIKNLPKDGWVKFNAGATGFYQVHYDEQLFNAIKPHVKNLTPRDRVQIEADLYAACKAGIEKSSRFLDVSFFNC